MVVYGGAGLLLLQSVPLMRIPETSCGIIVASWGKVGFGWAFHIRLYCVCQQLALQNMAYLREDASHGYVLTYHPYQIIKSRFVLPLSCVAVFVTTVDAGFCPAIYS